jgi:hypothetical protein
MDAMGLCLPLWYDSREQQVQLLTQGQQILHNIRVSLLDVETRDRSRGELRTVSFCVRVRNAVLERAEI